MKGTGAEFVAAKLKERDDRHDRADTSRYMVEPNVKEGKGGLRDLHTLMWIAEYLHPVDSAGGGLRPRLFRPPRGAPPSSGRSTSCMRCAATCTSPPAGPRSG